MKKDVEYNNIFYFHYINKIGGVENFFYELAKKYKNWDIVIFYSSGDEKQIARLAKYVPVKKYDGSIIKCKKAFFNYQAEIVDRVQAEDYYMIIHADYVQQGLKPNIYPKINHYIGVSKAACDSFTKLTGKPCQLCYNPITIDQPTKTLRLVSATRMTSEKGKQRIKALAEKLDDANIPYVWDIYTNDNAPLRMPHLQYHQPTLDINPHLKNADYVVQLSDSESYCYTVVQALLLGTPVIVCPWPCLKELKIDKRHGFILPFDMKVIPVQEIYNKEFKFTYEAPADCWDIILSPGESSYQKYLNEKHTVITNAKFKNKVTGEQYAKDQIITLTGEEIERINSNKWCIIHGINLVSLKK